MITTLEKSSKTPLVGRYIFNGKQTNGSLAKYNLGIYKNKDITIFHYIRKDTPKNIDKTKEYLSYKGNGIPFQYLSRLMELGKNIYGIDDKCQHYKVEIVHGEYLEIMNVE